MDKAIYNCLLLDKKPPHPMREKRGKAINQLIKRKSPSLVKKLREKAKRYY